MDIEKIKNTDEEVKIVKSKYKKMRRIILLIILLIILAYVGNLVITTLRIQHVLQSNVGIDLGNNYKITRYDNGNINTVYYKNGIFSNVFANGKYGMYKKNNEVFQVMYESKQYKKIDFGNFFDNSTSVNLLNYLGIEKEYLSSLKNMLVFVYQANVKFSSEVIDNQKYFVIEMKAFGEKLWVNADTYLIEKENMDGQIIEQKIEKNVVTDEDIKAPWDLGFTEII